ncbi:hypothetical protein IAT38_002647 [Cryptococcus sp. DSM 104549]
MPAHTASSLASRATDLIPEVAAATGRDLTSTLSEFSQYSNDFSTATDDEKRYIAQAISDEWDASGMAAITGRKAPKSVAKWTEGPSTSRAGNVRAGIQEAVSKARSTIQSFQGLSFEGDEGLRGRLADLVQDACETGLGEPGHTKEHRQLKWRQLKPSIMDQWFLSCFFPPYTAHERRSQLRRK